MSKLYLVYSGCLAGVKSASTSLVFLKTRVKFRLTLNDSDMIWLVGCLVGFLTSSSTTRLYRGRVPRLTSDNITCCRTRDGAWGP